MYSKYIIAKKNETLKSKGQNIPRLTPNQGKFKWKVQPELYRPHEWSRLLLQRPTSITWRFNRKHFDIKDRTSILRRWLSQSFKTKRAILSLPLTCVKVNCLKFQTKSKKSLLMIIAQSARRILNKVILANIFRWIS